MLALGHGLHLKFSQKASPTVFLQRLRTVWIVTRHIVDLMPAQQRMPQVGIQLGFELIGTTLDRYLTKPIVPFVTRFLHHLIEIPVRTLRLQVMTRILKAGVGNADFHHQLITCLGVIAGTHPCMVFRIGPSLTNLTATGNETFRLGHRLRLEFVDSFQTRLLEPTV